MKKSVIFGIIIFFMCIICFQPVYAKPYKITKNSCNIYIGKQYYFKFNKQNLTYKLSKKNVVSLKKKKDKYILIGKREGLVTIKFYSKKKMVKKFNITVKKETLSSNNIAINLNNEKTLKYEGEITKKTSQIIDWHINTKKYSLKKKNKILWSVKNPSMVSIKKYSNNTIIIEPKKVGTTQVKVWVDGKKYISNIECYPNVQLSKNYLNMLEGEKATISLDNSIDTGKIIWTVEDEGIIKLDSFGNKANITALKYGKTRICAEYGGKRYYCSIDVEEKIYSIGEYVFSFDIEQVQYLSDHTFVGDKLYVINASDDENQKYRGVTIYDIDMDKKTATYSGRILHNLGHANSIDYCNSTDTLILGNGSGSSTLSGKIYILQNLTNRVSWELDDCVIIDMASENWGIRMNVVWGEEEDTAYVITNDNQSVHKILLSKKKGIYDGGYTVIESWTADRYLDCNNGTDYYNGKLYEAIGHDGFWILENTFLYDSVLRQKQIKMTLFDQDGNEISDVFGEGIAIKDDYVFWGCSDGTIKVFKLY